MAYIREHTEELTGYQDSRPFKPSIDLMCDFVMVYGIDKTMPERVKAFAEAGYVVHLMTGIAWGDYAEYLNGDWDGQKHWDEAQKERDGTNVMHGPDVPYMTPTVAFSDYLTERLKRAVDSGVVAIHLEEPEFWDRSGYSEAFQREYELRYHEPFVPQHESLDAHYRAARLKADLYSRALSRISQSLKEYAKVRYGRNLRFYVPTHSLLNYTQWKILSPEAALIDIPSVDGFIAQIWTGTSRVCNVYEGFCRERTFETAFLEYGVMQELARGTGRRMWFLNDPIEDRPAYTWENYRYNYTKTAIASLLHPRVWHYEICPWPTRIFEGKYPRITENSNAQFLFGKSKAVEASKPIPDDYRTFLSSMFQLFGDMNQPDWAFDGVDEGLEEGLGIFLSDTELYERTYPDTVPTEPDFENLLFGILAKNTLSREEAQEYAARSRVFMEALENDEPRRNAFLTSPAFPSFYGLAMPLLKYGLPVRPVQLDNVRRFPGYLSGIRFAVLSYEFMKPVSPDIHMSLAAWVREGGVLIYVGDGSDPFHGIRSWWRDAGYANPAEHLFETLGLDRSTKQGTHPFGKGRIVIFPVHPASICLKKSYADLWRQAVRNTFAESGVSWHWHNDITLRRGPYLICEVMDESSTDEPKVFDGCFADLMADGYPIIDRKTVYPDEGALLYDLNKCPDAITFIGTAARILDRDVSENELSFRARAADRVRVTVRVRLPFPLEDVSATDETGAQIALIYRYDEPTRTALFIYRSEDRTVRIHGRRQKR